jgi:hypothetical protein
VSCSERLLIIGRTLKRLTLELSIKILSIAEYKVLLNLIGKSTIWNKYDCRKHDSRSLKWESLEESTFKSPHMINSVLVLNKYFKGGSN